MVAGGPISWECKRQDIVVLSTVEAEFMAFSKATTQALWLLKYFDKIGLLLPKPLKIFTDNNGSISNSLNDKNHWCTKHIDVQHHFIKEHTKSGDVIFQYTPTSENIADILTKALPWDTLHKFVHRMGLNPRVTNTSVQGECWCGLTHKGFTPIVLLRHGILLSETRHTQLYNKSSSLTSPSVDHPLRCHLRLLRLLL